MEGQTLGVVSIYSKSLLFLVTNQSNIDPIVLVNFGFWKIFIHIFAKFSNCFMHIGLTPRTVVPLLERLICCITNGVYQLTSELKFILLLRFQVLNIQFWTFFLRIMKSIWIRRVKKKKITPLLASNPDCLSRSW